MKDYIGLKGHKYNIGELLSEKAIGAEGSVCEVIGEDDIVAKIYHKDVLLSEGVELENKLKLMMKKEIVEKHDVFSIAWPRDVLYENVNGESVFVGYTMRKITAKYTLSDLYTSLIIFIILLANTNTFIHNSSGISIISL